MEDMLYITQIEISISDIALCLETAGYKTANNDSYGSGLGTAIIVFYPILYQGEVVEDYCRWLSGGDIQKVGFEPAQIRRFHRKDPQIKHVLHIMYGGSGQFFPLAPVFKHVLECYGGYIYLEGQYFSKDNIEDMQYVKLGSFSEDQETDI